MGRHRAPVLVLSGFKAEDGGGVGGVVAYVAMFVESCSSCEEMK